MAIIKTLKDKQNNIIYPQSHTKAIMDNNGATLEEINKQFLKTKNELPVEELELLYELKQNKKDVISEPSSINYPSSKAVIDYCANFVTNTQVVTSVNNQKGDVTLKTSDLVNDSGFGIIPNGLICMWSGTSLPLGWFLCDGQNGTPDLRDRFIVGAGNEYSIGNTGGEKQHTLTVEEIPSHVHTAEQESVSNKFAVRESVNANGSNLTASTSAGSTGSLTLNMGKHTHTINPTGGGMPHENRPPYYALAYIMKA